MLITRIDFRFVAVLVLAALFFMPAWAAPLKVAFVIGNSDYKDVPKLKNPRNDAEDLAKSLTEIGFEVTTGFDMTQSDLLRGLRSFQAEARTADVAIIYYAGHGIEVGKQNYLIPTDAALKVDTDVPFETVELDNVVLAASGARQLSLVILDACRNNPFANQMTRTIGFRSVGRGLAEVEPQGNTLIAFAAKAGTVASDGKGRNSPYAQALVASLKQENLEVGFLFREVRDQVLSETRGAQEPFFYGSLSSEKLYLNEVVVPEPAPVATVAAAAPVTVAPSVLPEPKIDGLQTQSMIWSAIKDAGDADLVKQFLESYPESPLAPFAKITLQKLEKQQGRDNDNKVAVTEPVPEALKPAPTEASQSPDSLKAEALTAPKETELETAALVSEPTVVVAPAIPQEPEIVLLSSRENISEIQERLTILKYAPGPIDGFMGNRTRGAISKFAETSGWDSKGDPTQRVLDALREDVTDGQIAEFRADQKRRRDQARKAAAARRAAEAAAEQQRQNEAAAAALRADAEAAAQAAAEKKKKRKRNFLEATDDDSSSSSSSSSGGSSSEGSSGSTDRGDDSPF